MSEVEAILSSKEPVTVSSMVQDIRRLGIRGGETVMVHTSMSRLGWVCGGAEAVVLALTQAVGPRGTVVMPTHSGERSDPAGWRAPPVPESWWELIRASMPPLDRQLTPTRKMGAVVECFRHSPGVIRSNHPAVSVAAHGSNARAIIENHELPNGMGERSPLARLYDLDALVLLLGVTHSRNTSLHLAEYRTAVPTVAPKRHSAPLRINGERQWASYDDLDNESDDFEQIGTAFAAAGLESSGPCGAGTGRLMRQRELVDFGVRWMDTHRPPFSG